MQAEPAVGPDRRFPDQQNEAFNEETAAPAFSINRRTRCRSASGTRADSQRGRVRTLLVGYVEHEPGGQGSSFHSAARPC